MATLRTVQRAAETGTVPTVLTADGTGDYFLPVGANIPIFIEVTNGNASPTVLTVADNTSVSPVGATAFTPALAVTITNGTTQIIKLAEINRFTSTVDGYIHLSWSVSATVTFKLFA